MVNKLFVYGTLGPGRPNEHVMSKIGGSWEKAFVRGFLHDKGWGADLGYPAITLDESGDQVEGFVFSSAKLSEYWAELDAFEGEAYERSLTTVQLEDKSSVNAFIYTLKGGSNP